MGFDIEGCKRAVFNTKNQGVEAAMNWVLEHMGDPDFASPFVLPPPPSSSVCDYHVKYVVYCKFSFMIAKKEDTGTPVFNFFQSFFFFFFFFVCLFD